MGGVYGGWPWRSIEGGRGGSMEGGRGGIYRGWAWGDL